MFRTSFQDGHKASSSDRFIPRRSNADFDFSHHLINDNSDLMTTTEREMKASEVGIVNTAKYWYNWNNYRTALKKVLLPNKFRVLEFSSPKKRRKSIDSENSANSIWPVEPRPKPLLSTPTVVLDMPDLDSHLGRKVIDWGKQGYVAATHEGEVHLWHPAKKVKQYITNTGKSVKYCIKWNKEGTHLAMALTGSGIAIWDVDAFKMSAKSKCLCLFGCTITAMEWTRTNCLITGCSYSRICFWTSSLTSVKTMTMGHVGDIINIKLSNGEKDLVTSGMDNTVKTWIWPEYAENFEIKFDIPIKSLDWHPWKDSLLAVGSPKYLSIWNVKTKETLDCKKHPIPIVYVDSLAFNPVSGELLVSYFSIRNDYDSVTYLRVLKDLDSVVDEIQYKHVRITYLLWDSTGTKLATAGSDENLCIWDFFGTSSNQEKKYLGMKKKKLTTDMFESLDILGHRIR